MLRVISSNRMENLAEALAENLKGRGDPLKPQVVVVQSRGMERWVSMELARLNKVAANLNFPFPRAFILKVLGMDRGVDLFSAEAMTWRLYGVIEQAPDPVKGYVDGDPIKRYELAGRLAQVYADYMQYRPDAILKWSGREPVLGSGGVDDDDLTWQAGLWKALIEGQEDHLLT